MAKQLLSTGLGEGGEHAGFSHVAIQTAETCAAWELQDARCPG